jgi:hypothetical protein
MYRHSFKQKERADTAWPEVKSYLPISGLGAYGLAAYHPAMNNQLEWQTIETAPKDRKARLVWCPERKNTYAVTWDERDETWSFWGGGGTLAEEPTHWMPLPQPPL